MRTDGRLDCRCACKPLSTLPWSVRAKGRMQENAGGSGFNSLLSYVPNHTHTHTHTVPLNCSTGAQLLCIGPPLQLNIPKPPATTAYATTVSVPPSPTRSPEHLPTLPLLAGLVHMHVRLFRQTLWPRHRHFCCPATNMTATNETPGSDRGGERRW